MLEQAFYSINAFYNRNTNKIRIGIISRNNNKMYLFIKKL